MIWLRYRRGSDRTPNKLNKDIGDGKIYTENSNKAHGHGLIDPNNFSPFPKNPTIAKFFKEMGLVDELGSGVRNIHKYAKTYFGFEPQIIEDDIFKIIFPTTILKSERIDERIMSELNENEKLIIGFLQKNNSVSNKEAVILTKLSPAQVRRIFIYLKEKDLIVPKGNGKSRHYILKGSDPTPNKWN